MGDHLELSNIDAIEACTREGAFFNPFTDVIISRHVDGEVAGAVMYSGYNDVSIYMSLYGFRPRWINRELIAICADYPFNQLGVERVFTQAREDNKKSLRIALKFGMKPIALIPGVHTGGVGVIIMKMERDECFWLALSPKRVYRQAA